MKSPLSSFFAAISALAVCVSLPTAVHAQTLADPVPLIGNQAQAIAGTAAVNGAIGHSAGLYDSKASKQEAARRKSHRTQHSECNDRARSYPTGSPRYKQSRSACRDTFLAQKATWKY